MPVHRPPRGRAQGRVPEDVAHRLRRAGVEGMLVYDLRRTAIRNRVRAGVRENVAMRISGHRTRNVFDRYDITSDEDIRQAMERTTEYVSSLPTARKIAPMKAGKTAKNEGSK